MRAIFVRMRVYFLRKVKNLPIFFVFVHFNRYFVFLALLQPFFLFRKKSHPCHHVLEYGPVNVFLPIHY